MVKVLILFFLNIKPTYGYNIQRFIEVNGMNQWAKIQAGSIYYALNKLEKDKLVCTIREEKSGSKIRKVFGITEVGREKLKELLIKELRKPIMEIESEKFMIYIMFNVLEKNQIIEALKDLISELHEKKEWWEKGRKLRLQENPLEFEVLNFDMVISNLEFQIAWHGKLIEEIDKAISVSNEISKIIENVDFTGEGGEGVDSTVDELKKDILNASGDEMEEKINKLVNLLQK